MELIPEVAETLADLATRHDLRLMTKGQPAEQQRKIDASGLAHHFTSVHIVAEKQPATYRELGGSDPGDLRWYLAYAAMRHGAIMRRVTERSIRFGEAERPADPDETIIHRRTLREMLDGTYWSKLGL